jgi:hypothetical protein
MNRCLWSADFLARGSAARRSSGPGLGTGGTATIPFHEPPLWGIRGAEGWAEHGIPPRPFLGLLPPRAVIGGLCLCEDCVAGVSSKKR